MQPTKSPDPQALPTEAARPLPQHTAARNQHLGELLPSAQHWLHAGIGGNEYGGPAADVLGAAKAGSSLWIKAHPVTMEMKRPLHQPPPEAARSHTYS
jgi:hypothetical protein